MSGNVGIGTENSSEKLQVSGNILTTGFGRFDGGVQVDGRRAVSNTNRSHTAQSNLSDYGYFEVLNNA